ncbi:MAG: ABC transporter ATP-binding protein [Bradymonadales bacterium]|nr:MAG: ABC transporter ATP-binding protein [Bradymonadales bacterium]
MSFLFEATEKLKKVLYFLGRRTSLWLGVSVVAGVVMGFAELGLSILLQALLVSLDIIQQDMSVLGADLVFRLSSPILLLVGLFSIIAIKGIAHFLVNQSSSVAHELINARLRCVAIYDLLHSKNFVSAAEVNAKIGDSFPKAAQFAQQASLAIPSFIQCVTLLCFMFLAAWKEALVSLAMISVIAMIVWTVNHHVRRIASKVPGEQAALVQGIERIARNWLLVKVLRTIRFETDRLTQNILNYSLHFTRSRFLANAASSLPIVLGGLMLVVIVALNLRVFSTPGPVLLAFLYLLVRFTQQLAALARSVGAASSYFPHFKISGQYFFRFSPEQLDEALHPSKALNLEGKQESRGATSLRAAKAQRAKPLNRPKAPQIEINSLSFRYSPDLPWVIDDLNLQIAAGEQVGVTGRSGSGKSTLLGLILGVLEPSMGKILIDGISPNDYFETEGVKVGYVGAEPFLIEGSIKENLEYGNDRDLPESEYWQALEFAEMKDCIEEMPGALDYRLKENGEGLSAGQKQRLALARAFLAKPQILILDEASANLDERTESQITEKIQSCKGAWTVIVVSHRPGILTHCEKVYDFERMELKETWGSEVLKELK